MNFYNLSQVFEIIIRNFEKWTYRYELYVEIFSKMVFSKI